MAEQTPATVTGKGITGLLIGIAFGILLYEGGLANYDVIEGQLLLVDFTFLEILLLAIIVATAGFFILSRAGLAERKTMQPSAGTHLAGGLIMGAGFALLGYGPATVLAAAGAGYPDALVGLLGILLGAGRFARSIYPAIKTEILKYGISERRNLPEMFLLKERSVVILVILILLLILWLIAITTG